MPIDKNVSYLAGTKHLRNLARSTSGNVAIIFALAVVPLLGAVGIAIDYSNASEVQARLQNSVDAAALVGAQALVAGQSPSEVVNAFVASNFADQPGVSAPVINVGVDSSTGTVTINSSVAVKTSIMAALGFGDMTVAANAAAIFGAAKNIEVALAFDVTYSMSLNNKMSTAQAAATDLINRIYAVPNAAGRVKIALVPFNYYVNVGMAYKNASWITNTADFQGPVQTGPNGSYTAGSGCVSTSVAQTCWRHDHTEQYDCSYTNQTCTVYPAFVPDGTNWTYTPPPNKWYGCVGTRAAYNADLVDLVNSGSPVPGVLDMNPANGTCPPIPLSRLNASPASALTSIAAFTPNGEATYIAPGLLWAWRTLSPDAPFGDGAAYTNGNTRKILILMTDGVNTHQVGNANSFNIAGTEHEGDSTSDPTVPNNVTAATCQAIKGKGISVYTIGFQVPDPTTLAMLRDCASSPAQFFNATTNGALADAFKLIAEQVGALRLSK